MSAEDVYYQELISSEHFPKLPAEHRAIMRELLDDVLRARMHYDGMEAAGTITHHDGHIVSVTGEDGKPYKVHRMVSSVPVRRKATGKQA